MKNLIIMSLIGLSTLFWAQEGKNQTMGQIKEWQLHTKNGNIGAKLSSTLAVPGKHAVLFLAPHDQFVPTVAEESELLGKILREMHSTGYEPASLTMISTPLYTSEFRDAIEQRVTTSGVWRSCRGRKYCRQAEPVANRYLKSIDAFKEFDEALSAHGLKRKSVLVDDMAVAERAGGISCSGMIFITLEPEAQN